MKKKLKEIAILTLIDSYHCDSYMASAALYRSFYKRKDKYKTPYIYLCSTNRIGYVINKIINTHKNISEIHFAGSGYSAVNNELNNSFQRIKNLNCQFIWYSAFADAIKIEKKFKDIKNIKIIISKNTDGCLEKMFFNQIINKAVLKNDPIFEKILLFNNGKRQSWKTDKKIIESYPLNIQWAKCCTDNFFWDTYNPYHIVNFIIKLAENGNPDSADIEHIKNYILNLNAEFIAKSPIATKIKNQIKKLANKNVNIVIAGETGTGKELLIRDMIKFSKTEETSKKYEFSSYNCASFPDDTLAISALFGHKKGAFTGSNSDRDGIFKNANGNTIVLDEIQELSLSIQARLLRTLESWTIQPLGNDSEVEIKPCRIIALTNANIIELIKKGEFRKDLWFRIADVVIEIPALRERKEDISYILNRIVENEAKRFNTEAIKIPKKIMNWLSTLNWFGNGRQIRNAVRRAYALNDNTFSWLKKDDEIKDDIKNKVFFSCSKPLELDELITLYINKVFESSNKNKQETRKKLNIAVNTVNKYLNKYKEK